MMKKIVQTIIVLSVIASTAWISPAQMPPNRSQGDFLGGVQGNIYKNSFFGLQMSVPKGWTIVDQETSAATARIGLDMFKGKNARNNKALEDAVKQEVVLLNVSKSPIGVPGNAVFMMATQRLASAAITPTMVAEATKSALATSPGLKLTQGLRVRTMAGKKFALLDYSVAANGQTASIKLFITVIKGYSLSFSLSYADEADLPELQKMAESMRISAK